MSTSNQIEISYHHQTNQLAGTLFLPPTRGPHPAIVMLHGSGPADRTNDNYFPEIRDYFVAQGFAVLCYDKPGIGASTGDWQQQSFADRADEALAAVDYLAQRAEIDVKTIGLWGHSQGGWIVYLAASKSDKVAFIIANSGPGVPPVEQDRYGMEQVNRAAGESEATISQALTLYDEVMEANRKDQPFEQIASLVTARGNAAWDRYFYFEPGAWAFLKRNFEYDPLPALRGTTCPVLAIFGELDLLVP
ncbi:MAG: alpha/beta hydrolase, partial [Chloroflexota bacterium]